MDTVNINIQELQNLKKIERDDVLVLYTAEYRPEDIRRMTELLGCKIIISPPELGTIEKMSRDEFIRIAKALDIPLRE